jgi:hypothetical protein
MPWRNVGEQRYSSSILDFNTRWRRVVSLASRPLYPRNPFDRWLGDSRSWSGRCGEEKNLAPAEIRTPAVRRYTDWAIIQTVISNSVSFLLRFAVSLNACLDFLLYCSFLFACLKLAIQLLPSTLITGMNYLTCSFTSVGQYYILVAYNISVSHSFHVCYCRLTNKYFTHNG